MKTGTPSKKVREEQTIDKSEAGPLREVVESKPQTLTVLGAERMTPAAMIGAMNNLAIPQSALPEEFQGQQLENIDTTFPPTVKWINPGNFVGGVYKGYDEEVGPNKSYLYHFNAKGKDFSIWGNTVLDRVFTSGSIQPGDMLLITYIGDIPTEPNPCKMFDVKKASPRKA